VQAGALSPGELIVLLTYVRSVYRPIRKGLGRSAAMIKAAASGERVLELLDAEPDLVEPAQPVQLERARGAVMLHGVCFSHDGREQVLDGIDLHIEAGQHVAIVGGNGAGKSTLATLIARLRDPSQGEVRLDGFDLRKLSLGTTRAHVAMVFQEAMLFEGTLRENIALGRLDADAAAVELAARRAGVQAFATRLPDGLDTPVGPRGADLSGGERQRVALARALLRDAAVYVFDEPTTGLDAASEAMLRDEILPALAGKTVLLITHDLRLLDAVDRIVRLEKGRVVSDEPPHQLVLLDGTGGGR
jgi:ATP-binding cassette subfamily B protein